MKGLGFGLSVTLKGCSNENADSATKPALTYARHPPNSDVEIALEILHWCAFVNANPWSQSSIKPSWIACAQY